MLNKHVRLGSMHGPLIELDEIPNISPLYAEIRIFETLMKLIYHLNDQIFHSSEEKNH